MKKIVIILSSLLLISVAGNIYLFINRQSSTNDGSADTPRIIHITDGNTRDTYRTVHNLDQVHKLSTGRGVRVGILDWGFAYDDHKTLYTDGVDFMTLDRHDENFRHAAEHGLWMAETLKEVAPDVDIIAIGIFDFDESVRVDAMIRGIEWAISNNIDILTLSHQQVSPANRERFDKAVRKAIASGITTCFIHYDLPENILPFPIDQCDYYNRQPDVNILQYDYNTLIMSNYMKYLEKMDYPYKDYVYYSISSTAVVTGGIVALMKSVNHTLSSSECKEILVRTSRPFETEGTKADHVADAEAAVRYVLSMRK